MTTPNILKRGPNGKGGVNLEVANPETSGAGTASMQSQVSKAADANSDVKAGGILRVRVSKPIREEQPNKRQPRSGLITQARNRKQACKLPEGMKRRKETAGLRARR